MRHAAAAAHTPASASLAAPCRYLDPLLFFEALLPAEACDGDMGSGSGLRRRALSLALVDTITVVSGAPRAWLFTGADGAVTQRRHFDRAAILAAWRANGERVGLFEGRERRSGGWLAARAPRAAAPTCV